MAFVNYNGVSAITDLYDKATATWSSSGTLYEGNVLCYSARGTSDVLTTPTLTNTRNGVVLVDKRSNGKSGPCKVTVVKPSMHGASCKIRVSAATGASASGNFLTITSGKRYAIAYTAETSVSVLLGFNTAAFTPAAETAVSAVFRLEHLEA